MLLPAREEVVAKDGAGWGMGEGDPVNKPWLNRLPQALCTEPLPALILKSGAIHQETNRPLSPGAEKSHFQREGEKLVEGKAELKRGRCVMEGDAVSMRG